MGLLDKITKTVETAKPIAEEGQKGAQPSQTQQKPVQSQAQAAPEASKPAAPAAPAAPVAPAAPAGPAFSFRARKPMDSWGQIMYMYGGALLNGQLKGGLVMLYSKSLAGTEDEAKLMKLMDQAAVTYKEQEA